MFYDKNVTIKEVEEEPSLIFELIDSERYGLVDTILSKKVISLNTYDKNGNSILTVLLKKGCIYLVEKYITSKDFDINHQNIDGDTFTHILVTMNYSNIMNILNKILKNKSFKPNLKNNAGETILDKSINNRFMYTSIKILEDKRFNNIDMLSFKNLYDSCINNKEYGKYTKIDNLEVILSNLEKKTLGDKLKTLVEFIKMNIDKIKNAIISNNINYLTEIINDVYLESV